MWVPQRWHAEKVGDSPLPALAAQRLLLPHAAGMELLLPLWFQQLEVEAAKLCTFRCMYSKTH